MKTNSTCPRLLLLCGGLLSLCQISRASPVSAIRFPDGNFLSVQGIYGSGTNTAYLAIDFINGGGNYAWQFNWNPGATVNGWQMLDDIAGESILSTNNSPTTTQAANPNGDPNLTVTATFYTSFMEHLITAFQYGSMTTSVDDWNFFTGTYDPCCASPTQPQGIDWTSASVGIDRINLFDGEFIGWVDVYPNTPDPILPETNLSDSATLRATVPEPCMALFSSALLAAWTLAHRPRQTIAHAP